MRFNLGITASRPRKIRFLRLSGDDRGRRAVEQLLQIGLQAVAVRFAKIGKFKRLQIALRRPQGKQHAHFGADRAAAHVKNHFHFDPFIQGRFQVQQSSGDGKLVQLAPSLPPIFQADQGKHRAREFHPWSPVCSLG